MSTRFSFELDASLLNRNKRRHTQHDAKHTLFLFELCSISETNPVHVSFLSPFFCACRVRERERERFCFVVSVVLRILFLPGNQQDFVGMV